MIRAIRDNPEVFAALVALIAVFGGLAGSYIGAKVQAKSGQAQANAATEAARIMVQYQHLASLHTDRRTVLAAFLHQTEAAADVVNKSLDDINIDSEAIVHAASTTFAELELILPEDVREAAKILHGKVIAFRLFVDVRGAAYRRRERFLATGDRSPGVVAARQALSALEDACGAASARQEVRVPEAFYERAEAALVAIDVPADVVRAMLRDAERGPAPTHMDRWLHMDDVDTARAELISAARAILIADGAP